MNIVDEARYVMSNVTNNNNKFWYIFRYDNNLVRTENGRVGSTGDSHEFPHDSEESAKSLFAKKCKEKERKGYKKLDLVAGASKKEESVSIKVKTDGNLSEIAAKQIEHTSPEITKLIKRLSDANIHNILDNTTMTYNTNTGLFMTPCGIVTKDTIDKARVLLSGMSDYVKNKDFLNSDYIEKLQDYLMLIPQKVGRKLDPETLYPSLSEIRKQNDILDSLEASIASILTESSDKLATVVPENKIFSVKLSILDNLDEVRRIKKKFRSTLSKNHQCSHLDVKTIYSLEIESMKNAFDKKGASIGNIKELWHGTRIFNVLSILKGGLQIPKSTASNVTGRLFGNGVYFSDISTKSLNYSYGYWDRNKRDENCFMFLCSVSMGKEYIPRGSNEQLPKPGYDSTFAVPGKSGIMNNEMIVYNLYQCDIKYLIEFSPGGK